MGRGTPDRTVDEAFGTPDVQIAEGDILTSDEHAALNHAGLPGVDSAAFETFPVGRSLTIDGFLTPDVVADRVGTWANNTTTGWQSDGSDGRIAAWHANLSAGTYQLTAIYYAANNRGIFMFEVEDEPGGGAYTSIATIDAYSASIVSFTQTRVTGVVIGEAGRRRVRVRVNGKNASSSSFFVGIQGISIERTA